MVMKCDFTQIYAEVGTSYNVSYKLWRPLEIRLDALGKNIPILAEKLKTEDFVIDYILSAKRAIDSTYIMGPIFLRKRHRVEFSIFTPYRDIDDMVDRVEYVLAQLAVGIKLVFEKYGVDHTGVDDCISEVVELIRHDPLEYERA